MLAAFVFLAAGMIPFASQLSADETHQLDQLLPAGAASVREYAAAAPVTGGGVSATVVLAAPSSGGRVGAAKISRFVSGLRSARIAGVLEVRPPVWVHDRRAALVEVGIAPDQRLLVSAVRQVRALAATVPGTDVGVAGPAAVQSDLLSTFTGAHGRLLGTAVLLVIGLLMITYRSPLLWLLPLACSALAGALALGTLDVFAKVGASFSPQSVSLVAVVVLGAVTDYAMLLTTRYREELALSASPNLAAASALMRTARPIVGSAVTVICALGGLQAARFPLTRSFGLAAMVGMAWAAIVAVTVFPGLLLVARRLVFRGGSEAPPQSTGHRPRWQCVAVFVSHNRRRIPFLAGALLVLLGCSIFGLNTAVTSAQELPSSAPSVQAGRLLTSISAAPRAGDLEVAVPKGAHADRVRAAVDTLAVVMDVGMLRHGADADVFPVWISGRDDSAASMAAVQRVRTEASRASGGAALVGGQLAQDADTRAASSTDEGILVPLLLAIVLLVLVVGFRALVAPILVLASVVASFAAALGIGTYIAVHALHAHGLDPTVPLLTFAFMLALSTDYNVFLLARMREELRDGDSESGPLRALVATGPVLTSAGLILAGTFGCLAVLPVTASQEIGLSVAVGVLVDTFVIRAFVIPAVALLLGRWFWWPRKEQVSAQHQLRYAASAVMAHDMRITPDTVPR